MSKKTSAFNNMITTSVVIAIAKALGKYLKEKGQTFQFYKSDKKISKADKSGHRTEYVDKLMMPTILDDLHQYINGS